MNSITIRPIEEKDLKEILHIYEYYVTHTAITFEYTVPTIEEFRNRMHHVVSRYPYIVAEQGGHIVGYAYANILKDREAYEWSVETSIYIDRDYRAKGLGKQLYSRLFTYLKEQGILSVYACITVPLVDDMYCDSSSYTYHKHIGFTEVGRFPKAGYKFNTWYDIVWMHMDLGEHTSSTKPIQYFRDILCKA